MSHRPGDVDPGLAVRMAGVTVLAGLAVAGVVAALMWWLL